MITVTAPTGSDRIPVPAVRRHRPRLLVGGSVIVAAVLVVPLAFLIWQAGQVGWGSCPLCCSDS